MGACEGGCYVHGAFWRARGDGCRIKGSLWGGKAWCATHMRACALQHLEQMLLNGRWWRCSGI